jgi:hypothetical protein
VRPTSVNDESPATRGFLACAEEDSQRGQVQDYSLSVAVAADGADPIAVALPLLVTGC